ncbi:Vacuolar protein sorting-associated protein 33, partial [Tetrabaena socialis]
AAAAPAPGFGAGLGPGRIDRLILLDREVDLLTPMMTQITFEGLLDEVTGIKHGSVPWQPKDKRGAGDAGDSAAAARAGGPAGRTLLNSTDPFYREFRDLPFHVTIARPVLAAPPSSPSPPPAPVAAAVLSSRVVAACVVSPRCVR